MNVSATLEKQLGPLPLWGWAVALGGAVIAFIILPKVLSHFSGQSQDSASGTANAGGMGIDPTSGLPTGIFPGGGNAGGDNSGQQAIDADFQALQQELDAIRNLLTPPTSPPPTPGPEPGPPVPIQPTPPPVQPPGAQPPILPPGPQPPVPIPPAPVGGPGGGPMPPQPIPVGGPGQNGPTGIATFPYVVKAGDTLSKIAASLGLSTTQIATANNATIQQYASAHGIVGTSRYGNYPRAWDYIYPGETLMVPKPAQKVK